MTVWNDGNQPRPRHPGIEFVPPDVDRIVIEIVSDEYDFNLEQLGSACNDAS